MPDIPTFGWQPSHVEPDSLSPIWTSLKPSPFAVLPVSTSLNSTPFVVPYRSTVGGIPPAKLEQHQLEVIVQAKDWQSAVKQGDLFHFKCVLDDLPNQPRGVFVTRTGYQQGAKDFAAAQGIILYELDELPSPPKKGLTITTLGWINMAAEFRSFKVPAPDPGGGTVDQLAMGLKATIFEPRFSEFAIQIDKTWFASNPDTAHIDISSLSLRPLPVLEVNLYDQNRSLIGNMEAIVRQELDLMKSEKLNQKHIEHTFDTPTFLGPESTGALFLKINKVTVDLEIVVTERPPHFNLPGFIKLVLRKIPSQKEQNFIARE